MKISQTLFKTEKATAQSKNDATSLLERGGFIVQNAAGIYSFLPIGYRVMNKIKNIISQELEKDEIEEVLMPILQPAKVWKESGRLAEIDEELWKIKNRYDEDFVLAMSGEELFLDTIKNKIKSYKDLPFIINQIQTKIRDEIRPKGGLMRMREFNMQDAYSFDKDKDGMHQSYAKMLEVYQRIFKRLELPVCAVEADSGSMGGNVSHEFIVESEIGEDYVVRCSKCKYASNRENAAVAISVPNVINGKKEDVELIHTPDMKSAEEVAEFLRLESTQVVKTMIYNADGKIVLALTRGDLEVNEKKLQTFLKASDLKLANAKEIDKAGLVAGFASPYKLNKKFKVIADRSVKLGNSFIVGANRRDYHYKNVNIKDLQITDWADLTVAQEGDPCPACGAKLKVVKSVELGHTFQIETKYSKAQKIYYVNEKGENAPIWMGSYGIGLERSMGTIATINVDRDGIAWPKSVAPFMFYLLNVGTDQKAKETADKIYQENRENFEIIYDDRELSPGEKFADADLIGIPYRITVSQRTLTKSSVEIKDRKTKDIEMVRLDKLSDRLKELAIIE